MECPHCRLINPDSAIRCDCGYNFATRSIEASTRLSQAGIDLTLQRAPLPRMWIGFALAALMLASEFIDLNGEHGQTGTQRNLVFLLFVLATWIYWLWCVHRYHDILTSIPGYHHPISPGQAVGRHFIPVYNLYWVFKWPSEIATFVNWRTDAGMDRRTAREDELRLAAASFLRTLVEFESSLVFGRLGSPGIRTYTPR